VDGDTETGLRQRKKQRTRKTIALAAMELFDRKGYQGTTIPEIAEAADVSPRTVSTYFPSKEEMVFENWADEKEDLSVILEQREPGVSVTDAIRTWMSGETQAWEDRRAEMERLRRVIDSDESLAVVERSRFHEFGELLADGIARDLDLAPSDLAPRLAAASMTAVLELLREERHRHGTDREIDFEGELALLDQGLEFVAGGLTALRSRQG